jgi:NADH dehydrogenase (ubiquinone) Fe-S protein 3
MTYQNFSNIKNKNIIIIKSLRYFLKILPIKNVLFYNDELVMSIEVKFLISVLKFLKLHTYSQYESLVCISGVDFLQRSLRFELNYDLLSLRFNNRLRIKICVTELNSVNSCGGVYTAGYWHESEIWDMFGVFFDKHPNLKRILTDYGFEGYPLRKDFPLCGFFEIKYIESQNRIVTESLELAQEYRTFNFSSPWK